MQKNREYVRKELEYLMEHLQEFIMDPLLGKSARDILEYFFIIFGGFLMFFTFLLADILGIILASTGYYKWLDKKKNRTLFGYFNNFGGGIWII